MFTFRNLLILRTNILGFTIEPWGALDDAFWKLATRSRLRLKYTIVDFWTSKIYGSFEELIFKPFVPRISPEQCTEHLLLHKIAWLAIFPVKWGFELQGVIIEKLLAKQLEIGHNGIIVDDLIFTRKPHSLQLISIRKFWAHNMRTI